MLSTSFFRPQKGRFSTAKVLSTSFFRPQKGRKPTAKRSFFKPRARISNSQLPHKPTNDEPFSNLNVSSSGSLAGAPISTPSGRQSRPSCPEPSGPESRPGQDTSPYRSPRPVHTRTGHQGPYTLVQVTKARTHSYRSPRPVHTRTGHQGPYTLVQVTKARTHSYRSPRPVHTRTGHQGPYRSPRPVHTRTGHQGPYTLVQVTKARTGHQGPQVPHHQGESLNLDGRSTLLSALAFEPSCHPDPFRPQKGRFSTAKVLLTAFF